jgi:hypothetical protein
MQKTERTIAIHLKPAVIQMSNVASISFPDLNITNKGAAPIQKPIRIEKKQPI